MKTLYHATVSVEMSDNKLYIRANILYEFKLGSKPIECYRRLVKAHGEDSISEVTVRRWWSKFKSGDYDIKDKPRDGRPLSVSESDLKAKVEANPAVTCKELAVELGVSGETVRTRLHALGKVHRLNKWVPHELTVDQKLNRVSIAMSLLSRQSNDPFLDRLMTMDEKWFLYYNSTRSFAWLDPW